MGSFIYLKEKTFEPAPGQKIIKAADYATWLDARQLIEKAQADADAIRARAEQEAEKARERGYRDGVRRGKAVMARQMLDVVGQADRYLNDFEDRIAATVITAVRKIVGELSPRDRMIHMVSRALAVVRQQQQVTIRVAPSQEALIRQHLESIGAPWPSIRFLDVMPDINLAEGTCILESELGLVEASIEEQLTILADALGQAFGRRGEGVQQQVAQMQQELEPSPVARAAGGSHGQ